MLKRIRKTQQVILCCEKPLSYTELIVHIKLDPTRTQPQEKKGVGGWGKNAASIVYSGLNSLILHWG